MQFFDYEELLHQIDEHRTDLRAIALSPRGKIWFQRLINRLMKVFLADIAGLPINRI